MVKLNMQHLVQYDVDDCLLLRILNPTKIFYTHSTINYMKYYDAVKFIQICYLKVV